MGTATYLRPNLCSVYCAMLSPFNYAQAAAFFVAFLVPFPVEPATEEKRV